MEYDVYHGRTVSEPTFDLRYVGSDAANDQYGPGFYFSDSFDVARGYATSGGSIIHAIISINKPLTDKRNITPRQVKFMIDNAPSTKEIRSNVRNSDAYMDAFYSSPLSDFGETFNEAYRASINSYVNLPLLDTMHLLWRDFYRYNPSEYLQNLTKLGYDGIIVSGDSNIYVVFSPTQIKTLDVKLIESGDQFMRNFIKSFQRPANKRLVEAILSGYDAIFEEVSREYDPSIDTIEGGLSDGMTVEDIAEKHGVSVDDILKQIKRGIEVEYEHTNDREIATEIAMDHLVEIPNYYDCLDKMERNAKGESDTVISESYDVDYITDADDFDELERRYDEEMGVSSNSANPTDDPTNPYLAPEYEGETYSDKRDRLEMNAHATKYRKDIDALANLIIKYGYWSPEVKEYSSNIDLSDGGSIYKLHGLARRYARDTLGYDK